MVGLVAACQREKPQPCRSKTGSFRVRPRRVALAASTHARSLRHTPGGQGFGSARLRSPVVQRRIRPELVDDVASSRAARSRRGSGDFGRVASDCRRGRRRRRSSILPSRALSWRTRRTAREQLPRVADRPGAQARPESRWHSDSDELLVSTHRQREHETRRVFIANGFCYGRQIRSPRGHRVARARSRSAAVGRRVVGTVVAYFVLGGKSYYALPVLLFALAAGAIPLDRWAARRRLYAAGAVFVTVGLAVLPISLPVLPLHTAVRHGVVKARGDYRSEIGWPAYVRLVERHATRIDVIVADDYGEAGALVVFGSGLPPVASADVTMRYWRPQVAGRRGALGRLLPARRRPMQRLSRHRTHLHSGRQR